MDKNKKNKLFKISNRDLIRYKRLNQRLKETLIVVLIALVLILIYYLYLVITH